MSFHQGTVAWLNEDVSKKLLGYVEISHGSVVSWHLPHTRWGLLICRHACKDHRAILCWRYMQVENWKLTVKSGFAGASTAAALILTESLTPNEIFELLKFDALLWTLFWATVCNALILLIVVRFLHKFWPTCEYAVILEKADIQCRTWTLYHRNFLYSNSDHTEVGCNERLQCKFTVWLCNVDNLAVDAEFVCLRWSWNLMRWWCVICMGKTTSSNSWYVCLCYKIQLLVGVGLTLLMKVQIKVTISICHPPYPDERTDCTGAVAIKYSNRS